ncbi:MAG: helix-turn-helix domain-containing protein [Candidatus Poseidoniaceae archaeon]|nr:helix-turn-helix domain-containing protein [Candidatus Poseidoniaceae archaeon]
MSGDDMTSIMLRLEESGLELKQAQIVVDLAANPPSKASEVGKRIGLSRMDAYNSLRKLQEQGLIRATLDKPMRFAGNTISEVFKLLIHKQKIDLQRMEEHLEELTTGPAMALMSIENHVNEATFSVIKDRHQIMATFESLLAEAESKVWLLLGRWGILHFLRIGGKKVLDDAIERGVEINIVACVDKKTVRYFDDLSPLIEVRHHEQLSLQGAFIDNEFGIQFVYSEDNPTGRGKEDTALLIESSEFLKAQNELLQIQWAAASSYSVARARIIDGEITEPLQYSLGEGSFYAKLKANLANGIKNNINSGNVSKLKNTGQEPINPDNVEAQALSMLGIDVGDLLHSVGKRIGREIAMKINDTEDDNEFWDRLATQWESMGMGKLIISDDEASKITVRNGNSCSGNPQENGIFCLLDEGILAGIMQERHGINVISNNRVCSDCSNKDCYYEIESNITQ